MKVCGACHACCISLDIPGLKVAGVPCPNLADGRCSIYDSRPQACIDFECGWKLLPMREDERPDLIGLLVKGQQAGRAKLNVLVELRVGAADSWKGQRLLKRLGRRQLLGVAEYEKPKTLDAMRICGDRRLVREFDRCASASLTTSLRGPTSAATCGTSTKVGSERSG